MAVHYWKQNIIYDSTILDFQGKPIKPWDMKKCLQFPTKIKDNVFNCSCISGKLQLVPVNVNYVVVCFIN